MVMPGAKPTKPKKPEPAEEAPDVEKGDEVYFRHAKLGPLSGRVASRGKDGCHVHCEGRLHQVLYSDMLGHKVRLRPQYTVLDQGEDGMIAEEPGGRRRYIHDPDAPEKTTVAKAMPQFLIFGDGDVLMKAVANRPGLSLQDVTDKAGHQTKRWKRTSKDSPKDRRPGKADDAAASRPGRGAKISFSAGDFKGNGVIVGKPGAQGAHVRDGSGRVHMVHWHEMGASDPHLEKTAPKAGTGSDKPAPKPAAAGGGGAGKPPGGGFYHEHETEHLPDKASQPHDSWDKLHRAAPAALKEFTDVLHHVSDKLGLRVDVDPRDLTDEHMDSPDNFLMVGNIKSSKRAHEKVSDYDGDWTKMNDIVRATIAVGGMDEVHEAIAAVKGAGLTLAQRPKDRISKPTREGYRDILTVVRLPGGMLGELQFHLKAMTVAKKAGHEHYETARTLEAKYKQSEPSEKWAPEDAEAHAGAVAEQKKIYGAAWGRISGGNH